MKDKTEQENFSEFHLNIPAIFFRNHNHVDEYCDKICNFSHSSTDIYHVFIRNKNFTITTFNDLL